MDKQVIGVFHSEEEAIRKIEDLKAQGYDNSDIYAVAKNEDDISMVRGRTNVDVRSAGGNWFDRFVSFITGEEPVREAMRNMGLSGPDMDRYYQEIEDGGILLYVDKEYGERYSTNPRYANTKPHDVHNVDAEFHTEADVVPHAEYGTGLQPDASEKMTDEEARMKLHEEKLEVDKKEVESGEVRIRKEVIQEEQTIDVPVSREEVYIERRPVDEREAMDEASAAFDDSGESIRIPIKEERLDVKKKPVVNEELIVGKKEVRDTETVRETVRREKADIERSGNGVMNGIDDRDHLNQAGQMNMDRSQTVSDNMNVNKEDDERGKRNKMERELEKRRNFLQTRDDNPYTDNDQTNRF